MRRLLIAALLIPAIVTAQTPAAAPPAAVHPAYPNGAGTPLGEQIGALLADPGAARAHWGIAVTAMDGTPIYGRSEGKYFRPASNAKLYTTAAAMALLGPTHSLTTSAALTKIGDAKGNVVGDLVLSGAGDGTFSSGLFPYVAAADRTSTTARPDPLAGIDELAEGMAKAYITHITGDVIGDDSVWAQEPYPTAWELDDLVWGYGAPVSALTVADNQLALTVTPGAAAGAAATATLVPETGYYAVQLAVQTVAAGAPASLQVERAVGSHTLRVYGTVAMGKPYKTDVAIDDPAEFAAQALKQALIARGVQVDGRAVARHRLSLDTSDFGPESRMPLPGLPKTPVNDSGDVPICTSVCPVSVGHAGPKLAEDVVLTLKESQNLHAELMQRTLGKIYGSDGSSAQGARVVRQWLVNAGIDGGDFVLYDGSGLSSHDLVTPRSATQLLAFAATQPWFGAWKAALPVGGVDGTAGGRFAQAPLKGHVFAKTGTLGESRALSGYVDCASGRQVIFSVMVDDHAPSGSNDRAVMDKIVAAIAANN